MSATGSHLDRETLEQTLEKVEGLCRGLLEGELRYTTLPDYLIACYAGRTVSYSELPGILLQFISPEFTGSLEKLLESGLGDFEAHLVMEDGTNLEIEYEPNHGILTIHAMKVKDFDVPESRLEYIYPDPIEDFTSMYNGAVDIVGQAKDYYRNKKTGRPRMGPRGASNMVFSSRARSASRR